MEPSSPNIEQLSIEVGERDSGAITVSLGGELDPHTAPLLERALTPILEDDSLAAITLDFEQVNFVDASGLHILIASQHICKDTDRELAVRNPSATVRRLFEITGLAKHITIIDTKDES